MNTFTSVETQPSTHHHRVPRGSEGSLGPEVRRVGLRTAATRTLGQVVIPWWEVGNWRKVGQLPGGGGTWQALVGGGTPFTLGQPGEAGRGGRSLGVDWTCQSPLGF